LKSSLIEQPQKQTAPHKAGPFFASTQIQGDSEISRGLDQALATLALVVPMAAVAGIAVTAFALAIA
jgi:ApbE superfamily uncharacterized protein (UPF0280 family)